MSAPAPVLELADVLFSHDASEPSGGWHFDLAVPPGARVALLGASGSGKSTLLDLVAGHLEPSSGTIRVADRDVTALHPARRPVTQLFQDHNLFAHLDVATNVALGVAPDGRITRAIRGEVASALGRVGLTGFGARFPAQLSGGERGRVALARVALRDRPVLLLDEAFGALGPALAADMSDLVRDLVVERGTTLLFVTHSPSEAARLATHVAFMDGRRIATFGPIRSVAAAPSAALRAYLGGEELL